MHDNSILRAANNLAVARTNQQTTEISKAALLVLLHLLSSTAGQARLQPVRTIAAACEFVCSKTLAAAIAAANAVASRSVLNLAETTQMKFFRNC